MSDIVVEVYIKQLIGKPSLGKSSEFVMYALVFSETKAMTSASYESP